MSHTLVLVDDDPLFSDALSLNLEGDGFTVVNFTDPKEALAHLTGDAPTDAALMIVDWQMPGMTGPVLVKALRAADVPLPAIFLTSHADPVYEETALSQGAIDFIDKTRGYSILKRRIDLALAHSAGTGEDDEDGASPGRLVLDDAAARATWHGKPVDLTLGEFRIVACLAGRPGRPQDPRTLYDLVRGHGFQAGQGEDGYRTNVRAFMKRIRQKFRSIDPDFDRIETRAGLGYLWLPADEGPAP